jgi:hypothetical protein
MIRMFGPRVIEATTWLLVADLMRRHEKAQGLRVIETHPGGGTYDCRTILQPTLHEFGSKVDLNLASGNLHVHVPMGKPRRPKPLPEIAGFAPLPYVEAMLRAEHRMQVVQCVEALVGLPSVRKSPATTRQALVYRLMAEIAFRAMFDGPRVRWENGRFDTSGYGPDDPIRPELRQVPALAARLGDPAPIGTVADRPGYWAWLWMSRPDSKTEQRAVAVLTIDAEFFVLDRNAAPLDVYSEYSANGRSVSALATQLISSVAPG